VFNAHSVGNKADCISSWISDERLSLVAIVETWHDGVDSPRLAACAPPGYNYVERARTRSPLSASDMTTNHGGVSLFYRSELHPRRVSLTEYTTMELVCVSLHCAVGINALVIVVYRPPPAPSCLFFDELADLLERTATYSSLMLVGDLNLHLDVDDDADIVKFELLVSSFNLVQHVTGPTQVAGHLLDVVLTRGELLYVPLVDVSPPGGLSDHSLIVFEEETLFI